jgi:hypothetical protein
VLAATMFARIRHYIGQICNGQIHRLAFCTAVKFVVSLFVRGQIRQFTGQICRFLSFPFFVLVKFVVCWSNLPFSVVPIFCTGQIYSLLVKFAVFCRSLFLYWSNLQFAGQICRFLSLQHYNFLTMSSRAKFEKENLWKVSDIEYEF